MAKVFYDTNILLYLVSADARKADRAETVLAEGGQLSAQILNEFVSVAIRKLNMPWPEIDEVLGTVRSICSVEPLTIQTHDRAREIALQYGYSFYDSLVIAAALLSECTVLYSEDMPADQRIGKLTIRNPFKS